MKKLREPSWRGRACGRTQMSDACGTWAVVLREHRFDYLGRGSHAEATGGRDTVLFGVECVDRNIFRREYGELDWILVH